MTNSTKNIKKLNEKMQEVEVGRKKELKKISNKIEEKHKK